MRIANAATAKREPAKYFRPSAFLPSRTFLIGKVEDMRCIYFATLRFSKGRRTYPKWTSGKPHAEAATAEWSQTCDFWGLTLRKCSPDVYSCMRNDTARRTNTLSAKVHM